MAKMLIQYMIATVALYHFPANTKLLDLAICLNCPVVAFHDNGSFSLTYTIKIVAKIQKSI